MRARRRAGAFLRSPGRARRAGAFLRSPADYRRDRLVQGKSRPMALRDRGLVGVGVLAERATGAPTRHHGRCRPAVAARTRIQSVSAMLTWAARSRSAAPAPWRPRGSPPELSGAFGGPSAGRTISGRLTKGRSLLDCRNLAGPHAGVVTAEAILGWLDRGDRRAVAVAITADGRRVHVPVEPTGLVDVSLLDLLRSLPGLDGLLGLITGSRRDRGSRRGERH